MARLKIKIYEHHTTFAFRDLIYIYDAVAVLWRPVGQRARLNYPAVYGVDKGKEWAVLEHPAAHTPKGALQLWLKERQKKNRELIRQLKTSLKDAQRKREWLQRPSWKNRGGRLPKRRATKASSRSVSRRN